MDEEKFALYGFETEIPKDWRVELNPKSERVKGDVAFQTPRGSRFFVSWGALEEAEKRFKSLGDHRDTSVQQIKKGPDVKSVEIKDAKEQDICGHRALVSHVTASVKSGFMSRNAVDREMWSAHFYCPDSSRYYIIYSLLRSEQEDKEFQSVFQNMTGSFRCHTKAVS